MITMFFVGALCGLIVTLALALLYFFDPEYEDTERTGLGVDAIPAVEEPKPEPKEFPIAGKPKRIPWAVKRRELEAQKREKRRRMEDWG